MAYQTSTNLYQNTRYVVSSAGNTPYLTIQSAINAANTVGIPAVVHIRPGTYTEDLTLYSTISLEGSESDSVIVVGEHTPPTSGFLSFTRIHFTATGTDNVILSSANGTTDIKFTRCRFTINNGFICKFTHGSGWTGDVTLRYCNEGVSANNGVISNPNGAGAITLSNSIIGTGTSKVMSVIGATEFFNVELGCPLTIGGSAASIIEGGSTLLGTLTTAGTANIKLRHSTISTGATAAIVIGSSVAMLLNNVVIDSTKASYCIEGTGTVNFNEATFVNSKSLAATITEGLLGVVKTGEIYADTIFRMKDTGFYSWAAGGPYFDDTTLGTFSLLVGGTGYIKGRKVTWSGSQDVTGMSAGNTYFIYIDLTGTIGSATAHSDTLYEDYIVLFECLRDSTGTNNQLTVAENHPYSFQTGPSNYLHDIVGPVIQNTTNGANIVISGTQKIGISGDDVLSDHGLDTTITATATVTSWLKYYTNAGGKWARQNATDSFTGYYNDAGTATSLGGSGFAVYTLYVTKNDLNSTNPIYIAVLDTVKYGSSGAASTAIANGTTARVTGELAALEMAQLGYIIYRGSTNAITTVTISKSTLKATLSTGGTNTASLVVTDVTGFNGILSAADTNVQAALDTIDNWGAGTTDKCLVVGNGTGVALGVLAVGGTGTILTGVAANDPTWTTATYPATIAKGEILHASAANVISALTAGTANYVLTAHGAGNAVTWEAATGGGLTWSAVTGDTTIVVGNGYIANKASVINFTLPATSAVGKVFRLTGMQAAVAWRVVQGANQIMHFGTYTSTTGAGGYIEATSMHDSVECVCIVADLQWCVISCQGNITVA